MIYLGHLSNLVMMVQLVVGAPKNDENGISAGSVKVYSYVDLGGGNFYTHNSVILTGEATGDKSGFSVSINNDGSIIALGAPYNGSGAGHVRAYEYNAGITTWVQLGSDIDGDLEIIVVTVCLNNTGTILAIGSQIT